MFEQRLTSDYFSRYLYWKIKGNNDGKLKKKIISVWQKKNQNYEIRCTKFFVVALQDFPCEFPHRFYVMCVYMIILCDTKVKEKHVTVSKWAQLYFFGLFILANRHTHTHLNRNFWISSCDNRKKNERKEKERNETGWLTDGNLCTFYFFLH